MHEALCDLLYGGRTQLQGRVEELIEVLRAPGKSRVRRMAASALGWLEGAQVVEALVAALDDADVQVCIEAIASLGRIGDRRAVNPLCAMLKNGHVLRQHAAEALGEIGDPRTVGALIGVLGDACHAVRVAAIRALSKIGDPRAIDPLVAVLGDPDASIRRIAASALCRIHAALPCP